MVLGEEKLPTNHVFLSHSRSDVPKSFAFSQFHCNNQEKQSSHLTNTPGAVNPQACPQPQAALALEGSVLFPSPGAVFMSLFNYLNMLQSLCLKEPLAS